MAKNFKGANHTMQISRRVNFMRNGEKLKNHKIGWCGGGLKQVDITTNNVGENDLLSRMEYIMVRLDN